MSEYIVDLAEGYANTVLDTKEEIVRCEDCKYYDHLPKPFRGHSDWCLLHKNVGMIAVTPNGFCAWGERRDDD